MVNDDGRVIKQSTRIDANKKIYTQLKTKTQNTNNRFHLSFIVCVCVRAMQCLLCSLRSALF